MPVLSVEIVARRPDLHLTPYQQIQAEAAVLDALSRFAPTPGGVVLACAHVLPWPQGLCVQAWCAAPCAETASEAIADHLNQSLTTTWEWFAGPTYVATTDN